ncbi:hypothetical protein [Collimonas fungivorans]|uniref:hypothetical protein n=1 Tax=Collimonas fungivorans TaxID=158899 RepID=UPI0007788BC7|nr:hypothetical protein [Collimonas fungivorans]
MSTNDWWLPALRSEIEQGDLIKTKLQFQPVVPIKFLARGATSKNQKNNWEEADAPKTYAEAELPRILATVIDSYGLVLSYGCELENMKPNAAVLIAPVTALSKLDNSLHEKILNQEVFRYLPVIDIPGIGNGYAHLGKTYALPSRLILSGDRIKSMTDEGIERVQAQLVGYYTRKKLTKN